jgi:hypothetical protein
LYDMRAGEMNSCWLYYVYSGGYNSAGQLIYYQWTDLIKIYREAP